jgi:hypothetical protein
MIINTISGGLRHPPKRATRVTGSPTVKGGWLA